MKSHNDINLSKEDLELLNSSVGLKNLFRPKKVNIARALEMTRYETKLRELQAELVNVQYWVREYRKKVIIIFEGRDVAGKGGAINRITAHINPRHFNSVALPKPSEDQKGQWYFQRYVNELPKPGEMVFFDRSWYNRAVVEPVNGFCTEEEYRIFMDQVNEFEKMILESGIMLIKFFLQISKETQAERFAEIDKNPLKKWKHTSVDSNAQKLWTKYDEYEERMFAHTHRENAPWIILDANKSSDAILKALDYILQSIPYKSKG
jgi:polyphosphate kinase 2